MTIEVKWPPAYPYGERAHLTARLAHAEALAHRVGRDVEVYYDNNIEYYTFRRPRSQWYWTHPEPRKTVTRPCYSTDVYTVPGYLLTAFHCSNCGAQLAYDSITRAQQANLRLDTKEGE